MAIDFSYSPYDHLEQQQQQQQQQHQQKHDQDQEQEDEDEDDYIDMEVSSYYSNLLKNSPIHLQSNEFEFRTQSGPLDRDPLSTTSPADELFYKGQLLPLHLPPRLQIIKTLLLHDHHHHDELYTTPLATTPTTTTPFLSCNVSPTTSCHVSMELNPEEYFLECSNEEESKKSSYSSSGWSKKFRMIKHSSLLGSKIKASRAYFKYLFGKSDEKGSSKRSSSISSFGETKADSTRPISLVGKESVATKVVCHRRSFSGAFKLRVPNTKIQKTTLTTSSSSGSSCSSSSNSNGSNEAKMLKRSGSANAEFESAIAGAIAHCKESQSQVLRSRKTFSEIGMYNF